MRRRNDTLGSYAYSFPKLFIKGPPAEVYKRKDLSLKEDGRAKLAPLSWSQVCELRRWHEEEGLGARKCFQRAVELGWSVTSAYTIQHIIDYVQRNKK